MSDLGVGVPSGDQVEHVPVPRGELRGWVAAALGVEVGLMQVRAQHGEQVAVTLGEVRRVVAADPAAASLEVAKSKDTAGAVTWVHAEAARLPAIGADLALMTGNVAQVFLTDHGWAQALQGIGGALRSRGHLVFETRRPGRRAWEDWAASTDPVVLDVPGNGRVERRSEVTSVRLPWVSFRYTYTFLADGAVLTSDSTLRFRGRAGLESSLAAQGYRVLEVRDAPDRPGYEYVFLTERTT